MSIRSLPRPGIVTANRGLAKPLWPFSINHDSPQANGLHLWWPFIPMGASNAAGDVIEMVHGLDGLMRSGPNEGMDNANWLESDKFNEVSPKLNFRGNIADIEANNSHVDVAESVLIDEDLENDEITVCCLALMDAFVTGDDPAFYSKRFGDQFALGWNGTSSNPTIRFRLNEGATTTLDIATTASERTSLTSHWHWFIGRYKDANPFGDNMELIVGSADSASDYFGLNVIGSSNTPTGNLVMEDGEGATIGGRQAGTVRRSINGQIADLRIYTRHVPDDVLEQMIDPRTRWDLYYPLRQRIFSIPAAALAVTVPEIMAAIDPGRQDVDRQPLEVVAY